MSAYRKLDPLMGRPPQLHVTWMERRQTNEEIRAAVKYCKKDNYLAVAFGVDEARVASIRSEALPGKAVPSYARFGDEGDGALAAKSFRKSTALATYNLHKRIMKAYDRRARHDGTTLNEAAFALGMRP